MFVSCVYVVLSCVGRVPCDGLITRPEKSYRVSIVCDHRNPEKGLNVPGGNLQENGKKERLWTYNNFFQMLHVLGVKLI
jgi:hypothetical protein